MSRVIYWFRTDLRLHDSPALHAALALKPKSLIPLWCWDPEYVFKHHVGINRWNFLLESMQNVSDNITKINKKSKLHVVRGQPQTVLPALFKAWEITHLVYEKDTSAYGRVRDESIRSLAKDAGVEVLCVHGHTLYDSEELDKHHKGKPITTASALASAAKQCEDPQRPHPAPKSLPDPGDVDVSSLKRKDHPVEKDVDLNAHLREQTLSCFDDLSGPEGDFAVPTFDSLGFTEKPTTKIKGGEDEALRRLKNYCEDQDRVASFQKPKTSPCVFNEDSTAETTLLSPYLKFGCLGVRQFLYTVQDTIEEWKGKGEGKVKESQKPENLEGQLIFRDMYYAAEFTQGLNFGQIRGNALSRYINWHLQNQYDGDGNKILPRPDGDEEAEERFTKWKEGRTGFPWIDACMRQLKQEGWIHHLARHSVACFLTRGQCYISWERGAEVFDEFLIDWDPCSNPGNWMWLSCSAFFSQYFRVYGLVSFPQKYDKTGALVRKYCPELAKFPDKYIYAPHTAPQSVQKEAGCIVGKDYPEPMLDEKAEKEMCLARLKAAYSAGLHGDSEEVLSGKANEILDAEFDKIDNGKRPGKKQDEKKRKGDPDEGAMEKHLVKKKK